METPQPSEQGPPPPARRSTGTKIIRSAVFGLAVLGFAYTILRSYPRGSAAGELSVTGVPRGGFTLRPVSCYSGGHWGFDGVWVVTETLTSGGRSGFRGGLKLVARDARWDVFVEDPNACQGFKCELLRVEPARCRVFDVAVTDRKLRLRRDGHAMLDCDLPTGGTVKAALTFRGCAEVPTQSSD